MSQQPNAQPEPSNTPTRKATGSTGGDAADIVASATNGIFITGPVMVIEEPRRFQGTSKGGKAYDMTQRRIQIFTGNKLVECSERLPDQEPGKPFPQFSDVQLMQPRTFRVSSLRMNNGQPVFDIVPV